MRGVQMSYTELNDQLVKLAPNFKQVNYILNNISEMPSQLNSIASCFALLSSSAYSLYSSKSREIAQQLNRLTRVGVMAVIFTSMNFVF